MDHLQPEDSVRGVRQRRKQCDPIACPVCGVTVRPGDFENHYAIEVERLHKLHITDAGQRAAKAAVPVIRSTAAGGGSKQQADSGPQTGQAAAAASVATAGPGSGSSTSGSGGGGAESVSASGNGCAAPIDPKECWSTYQRIKSNRQSRLKIKSRKRKSDDPICPVCSEHIADDINVHVELCLRRSDARASAPHRNGHPPHAGTSGTSSSAAAAAVTGSNHNDYDDDEDDDISIDVESEPFEEYEWAGQTRIRSSSLLQGGYGAAGIGTALQAPAAGDEDEDLNVDGDDSHVFGQSQYGERDVIVPSASTNKEQTASLYLRNLVAGESGLSAGGGSGSSNGDGASTDPPTQDTQATSSVVSVFESAEPSVGTGSSGGDSKDQIIESLKARLREHETQQRNQNKCKCLICMDEFRVPVVSICCWHVHCEECWLRTLGARKLCPQCNMITSPADLRRIYM